jgi:hypothetical protein
MQLAVGLGDAPSRLSTISRGEKRLVARPAKLGQG